ncbi:NAD-dependent protein deacetylase [Microlunatus endophyticus]|uniref:protein acetyllysine N-acetyltransferase n=1 Tax=Microlunatus endophyticus TaxID=1716077 RepID=A0A917SGX1_9ACTN|nr:NAD-dependent protein deacetylase [Microlunatus endophyticus]GGL78424.1 NAD-dependent protein deacetylase [Microlunatus endophyticus]
MRATNLRFGADWAPSRPDLLARSLDDQLDELTTLITSRTWTALTGAGLSTDSGIPDYRGPESARAMPMLYGEFVGSAQARQRYWARSFLGWQRMRVADPNAGHRALVQLEAYGCNGVITQNVDGLHHDAGSDPVIDLHGRISDVICLDCGQVTARADYQQRLLDLNPGIATSEEDLRHAELRPDGDAVVDDWSDFVVARCMNCGGVLKPDVIFFGESVPKERVQRCYHLIDQSELLLVAGSSLAVMSGLRFVRHDAKAGKPVIIINRGATRGDDLATLKIDAGTSEILTGLLDRLRSPIV